ncbi:RNA polymerase sigma factor [Paenibacillus sp. 1P07SE]|uniref:RNA polymerase sigma factor n=1 Tax=Paenibacillus sp. 1P07SE TaxID=3132209 RepID=UPI0039A77A80
MNTLGEINWNYLERMDADSFRHLMELHGQDVWNLAFTITKKHDMADDVTQDVFLKVYHSIHTFRGTSSIKTWLLSITRNMSINHLRSAFLRRVTLMGKVSMDGGNDSAEKVALDNQFTHEIWSVVLKLPLKLREVLILHAKFELNTKEIADVLQLPEGTVKSRLSRARQKMNLYWKGSAQYD